MLPFAIPAGTTLESLVTEVIPAAHGRMVPASAGRESFTVAVEIEGEGAWIVALDGPGIRVRAGEEKGVDARIRVLARDAQDFLTDWMGPQTLAPKFKPQGEVLMMSDPRLLKRIKMVTGVVELAIRDFEGRRVTLSIAVGAPAKKVEPDPDVVIEVSLATYQRLLDGTMGPEEALADGEVTVKGKRLVAMQFAFAIAPLFPPKR